MGRGKGSHSRRDAPTDQMVHRRPLMEPLPFPTPINIPAKRSSPISPVSSTSSQSSKRTRPSPPPVPRFLYHPGRHLDVSLLLPAATPSRPVDVLIPADHFTASNPALRTRQVWGHHDYTDDSDLVAIVAHSGLCVPPEKPIHNLEYVRARVELHRPHKMKDFPALFTGALASRAWPGDRFGGVCIRVEAVDLLFMGDDTVCMNEPVISNYDADIPGLVPWGTSDPKGKKPGGRTSLVAVDMSNEPCLVYHPALLEGFDAGIKHRLDHEVLYLENATDRYEIAKVGRNDFRFARVNKSVIHRLMFEDVLGENEKQKFPLDGKDKEVLDSVLWQMFYWDNDGLSLVRRRYPVTKIFFRDKAK